MSFSLATVPTKPTLYCLGQLAEISEPKSTTREIYYLSTVKIKGVSASRDHFTNFMFRPEWFSPNFNAGVFDQQGDEGKSLKFVYRRNMNARDQDSFLRAVCGEGPEGDALFEQVAQACAAVAEPDYDNATDADVLEYVRQIVDAIRQTVMAEGEGPVFGFKLKQGSDKVDGEYGEDGKPVRILNDRYELDSFFRADAVSIQRIVKNVEKANERAPGTAKLQFEA